MNKVLIYGVGTYKNRGVEAIINSTVNQIPNDYSITVGSLDTEYNKNYYKNKVKKYINHISTNSKISDTYTSDHDKLRKIQKGLLEEISKNDIIISSGGDNYSYHVGDWLYVIEEEAKKKNKKLILWAASILENIDDLKLINDMNLFDVLYIRESISYDAIKDYVDERKLILGPDPAFSLKPKKVELDEWYKDRKVIGLNLSPFTINATNEDAYPAVIELIKYILKETDYSISLIPHVIQKESNDMTIHKKIKKEFKNEDRVFLENDNYDCSEVKYIISQCDLMVASRTHASIAAYSSCVPTLVLGYSVKSKGIAKDLFGSYSNYVLSYEVINNKNLLDRFIWLEKNKSSIKEKLQKIMPNIIDESSHMFEKVLSLINRNSERIICNKKECIGCGLCQAVCPVHAISFEKDELGFIYPVIDEKKCIHCNLCRQKCPINNKVKNKNSNEECYAFKCSDNKIRRESSSGGFFSTLASNFIKNLNGVIYGVTNSNNKTKHIRIEREEDLNLIRGSKYTQSSMLEIYDLLDKDMKNDKNILFSGTPCQIAAIKRYVNSYDKIYFASIICHGVMSDHFVEQVLIDNHFSKETKVLYHCKDYAWSNPNITLIDKNGENYILYSDSLIMKSYLNNINERFSCYECNYKGKNNVADIIMGDYWGVNRNHPDLYDKLGVSAIIINSNKGKSLLKKLKLLDNNNSCKTTYEDINAGNIMLTESIERNYERYIMSKYVNNKSISLLNQKIQLQKEKNDLSARCEYLESIIRDYQGINEELSNHLESILNSKRWQTIDTITNKFTRILKK